jgi:hypothetical protein
VRATTVLLPLLLVLGGLVVYHQVWGSRRMAAPEAGGTEPEATPRSDAVPVRMDAAIQKRLIGIEARLAALEGGGASGPDSGEASSPRWRTDDIEAFRSLQAEVRTIEQAERDEAQAERILARIDPPLIEERRAAVRPAVARWLAGMRDLTRGEISTAPEAAAARLQAAGELRAELERALAAALPPAEVDAIRKSLPTFAPPTLPSPSGSR